MNPVRIRVEFWGPAREVAGTESLDIDFVRPNGITVGFLREQLASKFPRLRSGGKAMRLAVNEVFVAENQKLRDGDVVSVIPPVSGG